MREIMMVWHNYWKRKIHPNTVLGIFVIDTVVVIHHYHQFLSSRSPNVYRPSKPYAWQFLQASSSHKLLPGVIDSSQAANSNNHPLKAENPPERHYSLLASVLHKEKKPPHLYLVAQYAEFNLERILKLFFQSHLFGRVLSELLGYIFLIDAQFYELHELKVKQQVNNEPPKDAILPAVQGWFGVETARPQVDVLRGLAPDAPFIIAALNLDRPNAMPIDELRAALGLNKDVPIIPCETTHTASVHQVLFELLERHEVFYGKNAHADLARELIQLYKSSSQES
jgi:hypothetical protein